MGNGPQQLVVYKGNYENYLEKKAARMESEAASIDKARNTFRRELEWMHLNNQGTYH